MPSPFPGMDPYLESPGIWPDVHANLIIDIQAALNKHIRPTYVARVELRVYVDLEDSSSQRPLVPDVRVEKVRGQRRKPGKGSNGASLAIAEPIVTPLIVHSVEVDESRVEIRHVKSDTLVTVIEVLSPSNKQRNSDGRASFIQKRKEVLNSAVNWVEIDLLREGQVSLQPPANTAPDYRVAVSKAEQPRQIRFWLFNVREPLPVVGIPLRDPDPDVPLDLGAALRSAYERAAYDASVDYHLPPVPRLSKEDARWADKLLRAKKLR